MFGVGDVCRDTAMAPDAVGLAYPRAQLVIASRAAGIAAPIDSPTLDHHDLEDDTARSRASGMTGTKHSSLDFFPLTSAGAAPFASVSLTGIEPAAKKKKCHKKGKKTSAQSAKKKCKKKK